MAIWRGGQPQRSDLGHTELKLGDTLLLVGPREKLVALSNDPDFIVLTPLKAKIVDASKAPLAAVLLLGMAVSVIAGWLPIYFAAIVTSTLMLLTRCLTMEQAYRAIDWRAIFLIAGMLPLGIAMQDTGAAEWIASEIMLLLGDYGP